MDGLWDQTARASIPDLLLSIFISQFLWATFRFSGLSHPQGLCLQREGKPIFFLYLPRLTGCPPPPPIKLVRTSLEREREKTKQKTKTNQNQICLYTRHIVTSQVAVEVKSPPANAGLISGSGRSPEEGSGYPLQYSFLENRMDWEPWKAAVQRVEQSPTQLKWLSMHTCA